MNGKGDSPRPVDPTAYALGYERTFGKAPVGRSAMEDVDQSALNRLDRQQLDALRTDQLPNVTERDTTVSKDDT